MATASRELAAITKGRPSAYIIREAFHDSLRRYVRAVLECGEQTEESETLLSSAFESILQSGTATDIEWAQHRLGRAIAALDDGDYGIVQPHQSNFEKMLLALRMQKSICNAINCTGFG